MDEVIAWFPRSQFVEILSRLAIVLDGPIQMVTFLLFTKEGQQGVNCRANIANESEIDRYSPAKLLGSQVDLGYLSHALRIELTIREIRAEHQQSITVVDRVITGREAYEPGNAYVVGVVPFHMLLPFEGVDHRAFEFFAERKELIVGAGAARAAQHSDARGGVQ